MEGSTSPRGVSVSPAHARSASIMSGVTPSPPTLHTRLPSVTPPKPPPPYSGGVEECEAINIAQVKAQLDAHFKNAGIEGIALKYEAAITETAALRRQVHSLKHQLGKPDTLAFDPLPVKVTESPTVSPKRLFKSQEEEEMWKAMNVDVLTKLDAIDKVERIRQEYEDTQNELSQELMVKEEVLAMLTEQMRSMVDREEYQQMQHELHVTHEQLQDMKRERGMLSRQRDEACNTLHLVREEMEWKEQEAVTAAVRAEREKHQSEVEELRERLEESQSAAISQDTVNKLEDQIRSSQMALAAVHKQLDEKELEIARAAEVQKQLEAKEAVVRELADSLQAQALAHKQTLTEAQERESKIESLTTHRQKSLEIVTALQQQLAEREEQALELAKALEEKERESEALQSQLAGFTDHLKSHLLQKDEQMKRAEHDHVHELKMTNLKVTELETKAAVLQSLLDQKTEASRLGTAQREEEIAASQSALHDLREQNRHLSTEVEHMKCAMEESLKLHTDTAERQVRTLNTELSSLQRVNGRLEEQLNERNGLVTEQQENIASLQARLLQAEASLQLSETLTKRNNTLELHIKDLEAQVKETETRYLESEEAMRELKSKSTEVILSLTSQLDDVEQKMREQVLQEQQGQAARSSMCVELSEVKEELMRVKSEAATQASSYRSEAATAKAELNKTKESFNWLSANLEEVTTQLEDRDTAIKSFRAACEEKDEAISQLRALLHKSSEALDLLQTSAQTSGAEYKEKISHLTEEMRSLKEARTIKESELEAVSKEISTLKNRLSSVTDQNKEANSTIARLEEELQQRQMALRIMEDEKNKMARFVEDSNKQLCDRAALREAQYKREIESHLDRQEDMEVQRGRLEKNIALYEERVRTLEESSFVTGQVHIVREEDLVSHLIIQEESLIFECIRLNHVCQAAALRERGLVQAVHEKEKVAGELRMVDERSRKEFMVQSAKREEELLAMVSQLRNKVSSLEVTNEVLQEKVTGHATTEAQCKERIEEQERTISECKHQVHSMTLKLDEARRTQAAQVRELELDLAAKVAALEKLQSLKAEMQTSSTGMERALEESVQEVLVLREQLCRRESELATQSQDLAMERKHAQVAKQQVDVNSARIESLEKELTACTSKLREKNAEVLSLSSQVMKCEEEIVFLKSTMSAEKGESNVKSLSLQERETEVKRLHMQIESLRNTLTENQARLREKTTELEHLKLDKEDALSKNAAKLIEVQSAGLERAQKNSELEVQLELCKRAAKQAEEAQRSTQLKLDESTRASKSLMDMAERRIELLEEQLEASGAREQEMKDRAQAVELQMKAEYEQTVSILRCDLTAKEAALRKLQLQLDGANKNTVSHEYAVQAEKALTALTEEVQRLRAEAMNKDETLRAHGSVAHMHNNEVQQLRQALADEVARVTRLNQQVLSLHKQLGDNQDSAKLSELKRISDALAHKYREVEGMFCTPFITPSADGWDSNMAAAFIRTVKQWCIDYSDVISSITTTASISPAKVSPPRSKNLLTTVNTQPSSMPKGQGQETSALTSRSVNSATCPPPKKTAKAAAKPGVKPAAKRSTRPPMR
eukprot:TRINITY_DN11530_c0_g1_i2.p1 TRINITY_DN11530_c0_g1~~TRINITY_DN11530_c0_g1_i2.p1  ORF type:complete len:1592 (+),score=610.37 TRINITY_DN11530_c0_g1_i2:25-4776(+)